jgi:hypothetical protein
VAFPITNVLKLTPEGAKHFPVDKQHLRAGHDKKKPFNPFDLGY